MLKANQIWQAALGELQLEMKQAAFDTWLRDARVVTYEDGAFVIAVKNGYAKDWLETRLAPTIRRVLTRLAGRTVTVSFMVYEDQPPQRAPLALAAPPAPQQLSNGNQFPFNPRYTLDSFVVGSGNRLAHAAALAVVEQPGNSYNPLFIYGGTGLGKTHLLQAIGQACLAHSLRVLYVPAETFTNDLIEAIRSSTTDTFRDTYRTTDVLLVDDIQFIAGKEATQEEFFHTFNTLHANGGQIVVSSDQRPRALATLEERLRSRFEWGLMVDVRPLELETRIAILRHKATEREIAVADDVLYLIAQRVQTNIRELEGALNKALMLAAIEGSALTPQMAEVALVDLSPCRPQAGPEEIVRSVAHHYRLQLEDLRGRSRAWHVARPRQIAMYLLRQDTDLSLSQIGDLFGGRDHTTVLHACERISSLSEEDESLRQDVLSIRGRLYERVC